MGGHNSKDELEEDDEFLYENDLGGAKPFKWNKLTCCVPPKSEPHFGTPMPDSPMILRQKRQQDYLEQARQPVYSSKYLGLEKEPTNSFTEEPFIVRKSEIFEGGGAERKFLRMYELGDVLGVGSTSVCRRCVDRRTKRTYACKIIDLKQISEMYNGMAHQFHSEVHALRTLDHPNIIRLENVFHFKNFFDDKLYIVMELMEGGELFDYVIEKGTLNEQEASRIVRTITSALVYMHSQQIIHRDLKPENLLLTHKPQHSYDVQVKIIDFGLAKSMEQPMATSFLGTRGYLAPEIMQRRSYSRSVDVWSLGVIVFVLLCGCLPFGDGYADAPPTDEAIRTRFVLRFPKWANNLSAAARDLLAHLLEVDPKMRYTAEEALNHPWMTGESAPRHSLLQSPGRLKQTPGGYTPKGKVSVVVRQGHANRRLDNLVPPQQVIVRKNSI